MLTDALCEYNDALRLDEKAEDAVLRTENPAYYHFTYRLELLERLSPHDELRTRCETLKQRYPDELLIMCLP